jgi:hypothetical protein
MMKAVLPISIGVCTVLLASACSSSLPRGTPPQQGLAGSQLGDSSSKPATDPQAELSDRQGDGAAGSAAIGSQPDSKRSGALAPAQAANVDRSQTDVDNDMRKRGYKPTIYRGERVYCRNEALTGSNLESKVCLTAKQIEDQERSGKDILNGNRQAGCLPTKTGCN